MVKNYYKMMLGPKSLYVEQCKQGNFIGADYGVRQDLTSDLSDHWRTQMLSISLKRKSWLYISIIFPAIQNLSKSGIFLWWVLYRIT